MSQKLKDFCLVISTICLAVIAFSQYKNAQAQQQMTVVAVMEYDHNLRLKYINKTQVEGRTHEDVLSAMYSKSLK